MFPSSKWMSSKFLNWNFGKSFLLGIFIFRLLCCIQYFTRQFTQNFNLEFLSPFYSFYQMVYFIFCIFCLKNSLNSLIAMFTPSDYLFFNLDKKNLVNEQNFVLTVFKIKIKNMVLVFLFQTLKYVFITWHLLLYNQYTKVDSKFKH